MVLMISGAALVRRPDAYFPSSDGSVWVHTTSASRVSGDGLPSMTIRRTALLPISIGLLWRIRAPFSEMSHTETTAAPNCPESAG